MLIFGAISKLFSMNTSKSVSKQRTLSTFRIKQWGCYGELEFPPHNASPRVGNQSFTAAGEGYLVRCIEEFSGHDRRLLSGGFEVEFFLVACKGKSLELFWRNA